MEELESMTKTRNRKSVGLTTSLGVGQQTEMNRNSRNSNSSREEKEIQTSVSVSPSSNVSTNLENACWLIAAIACVYYSDIVRVLISDTRVYRSLMNVSFILIAVCLLIAFYLIVWLTKMKKIDSNRWNELHPTFIPIATACFVSASILLTISIWPIYTWFSAPLLFTIFMGIIVVLINVPVI